MIVQLVTLFRFILVSLALYSSNGNRVSFPTYPSCSSQRTRLEIYFLHLLCFHPFILIYSQRYVAVSRQLIEYLGYTHAIGVSRQLLDTSDQLLDHHYSCSIGQHLLPSNIQSPRQLSRSILTITAHYSADATQRILTVIALLFHHAIAASRNLGIRDLSTTPAPVKDTVFRAAASTIRTFRGDNRI